MEKLIGKLLMIADITFNFKQEYKLYFAFSTDLANENFPSDLEYISGKYMHENCDNNEDSKTSVKLQPIFDLILFSKQCDQHHQENNKPHDWAGVDSENGA